MTPELIVIILVSFIYLSVLSYFASKRIKQINKHYDFRHKMMKRRNEAIIDYAKTLKMKMALCKEALTADQILSQRIEENNKINMIRNKSLGISEAGVKRKKNKAFTLLHNMFMGEVMTLSRIQHPITDETKTTTIERNCSELNDRIQASRFFCEHSLKRLHEIVEEQGVKSRRDLTPVLT